MVPGAFFLLPSIQDRVTGGNIYNRRIMEGLARYRPVASEVVGEALSGDRMQGPGNESFRAVVVDSLLLRGSTDWSAWRETAQVDRLVLLTHYLRAIDPQFDSSRHADVERNALETFDGFITMSRYIKERLCGEGIASSSIDIVRPGLPGRFFGRSVPERTVRREPPTILTVASLLPEKGLLESLRLLEMLKDIPWKWRIVGDAELDDSFAVRFRRELENSSIYRRVRLSGVIPYERMIEVYDEADVFLLLSRFENCSMALMEAMARALPVVAHCVGGNPELVEDGVEGYLTVSDNQEETGECLRRLLAEPAQRRQMGRLARRRAEKQYSTWEAASERFHDRLWSLLGGEEA